MFDPTAHPLDGVVMLVTSGGLWSIATMVDMLDPVQVPAGEILDGRLRERMASVPR